MRPTLQTDLGMLYQADCMAVLPEIEAGVVDTLFADPPFNLNKDYGGGVTDDLAEDDYLQWCIDWITEGVRVLAPGGAFFLYHLPKWNMLLGPELRNLGMTFRHWIAIDQPSCLPIQGRLYPSHYSLLYFTKGKPNTFRRIRTPIQVCRHCGGEIKDYGGHRKAMNPNGVNLKDVWTDIPPVRHRKFKPDGRGANALSTKSPGAGRGDEHAAGRSGARPVRRQRHHLRRVRGTGPSMDRHRTRLHRRDHRPPGWLGRVACELRPHRWRPSPRTSRNAPAQRLDL